MMFMTLGCRWSLDVPLTAVKREIQRPKLDSSGQSLPVPGDTPDRGITMSNTNWCRGRFIVAGRTVINSDILRKRLTEARPCVGSTPHPLTHSVAGSALPQVPVTGFPS